MEHLTRTPMFLLILALLILTLPSHAHADITGKARIIDGDTIHISKTKIRLYGIDAPEMKQTCRTGKGKEQLCGVLAKQALERLAGVRTLSVRATRGTDTNV